jgi:uncharacterized membrane protein
MESRAKMMGHPVHPILVSIPLGLLTTSVIVSTTGEWVQT